MDITIVKETGVIVLMALFLATAIEGTIEYLTKPIVDKYPNLSPYLMYVSVVVGVVAAFFYKIDFVSMLANVAGGLEYIPEAFGMVLTGIVIGRGSNAVHNVISLIYNNAQRAKQQ